jgi:hypothetical protein
MKSWLLLVGFLTACGSSGGDSVRHSLDGFLQSADDGRDMAVAGSTTSVGGGSTTSTGGATTSTGGTTTSTGGSTTSTGGGTTSTGGGGLDPLLAPADGSGPPCADPGSYSECPDYGACRFYTSTEARCEDPTDGKGLDAPCSASAECDILFVCYNGACENFCHLGTYECGSIGDCLDIGYQFGNLGVCDN